MKRDIKNDKLKEVEKEQSPPDKMLKMRQSSPSQVTFDCGENV
jgi:hypothetical protein